MQDTAPQRRPHFPFDARSVMLFAAITLGGPAAPARASAPAQPTSPPSAARYAAAHPPAALGTTAHGATRRPAG